MININGDHLLNNYFPFIQHSKDNWINVHYAHFESLH